MHIARAVLRSIAVKVVKGQHRSQRLFAELLSFVERANRDLNDRWLDAAMICKFDLDRELERRRVLGIAHLTIPLPHPEHTRIHVRRGAASVIGPSTYNEKASGDDAS